MRRARPKEPRTRNANQADLCPDCDPGGGTPPPAGGSDPYFATARSRPENETGAPGIDLGSRNFNWGTPLVTLPGRAGMDLNFGITYNSLVWTKQGSSVMFNADQGIPSPGFRLSIPTLQHRFTNVDDLATSYMLIMSSGERIELRQVGTSNVYESQDNSYTQAIDYSGNGINVVVRTKDGTQYAFNYPLNVGAFAARRSRTATAITSRLPTTLMRRSALSRTRLVFGSSISTTLGITSLRLRSRGEQADAYLGELQLRYVLPAPISRT